MKSSNVLLARAGKIAERVFKSVPGKERFKRKELTDRLDSLEKSFTAKAKSDPSFPIAIAKELLKEMVEELEFIAINWEIRKLPDGAYNYMDGYSDYKVGDKLGHPSVPRIVTRKDITARKILQTLTALRKSSHKQEKALGEWIYFNYAEYYRDLKWELSELFGYDFSLFCFKGEYDYTPPKFLEKEFEEGLFERKTRKRVREPKYDGLWFMSGAGG